MTPEIVINIFQQTLQIILILISMVLMPALIVGLLVSVFQAATQINEMTLSFIPKLLVTIVVLMAAGHWMLGLLLDFSTRLFHQIPTIIG